MKELTMEQVQELLKNDEFVNNIQAAKSEEEQVKVLESYDIQISAEELRSSIEKAKGFLRENGFVSESEMDETALDSVAGGVNTWVTGAGMGVQFWGIAVGSACPPAGLLILGAGTLIGLTGAFMRK